ncbi:transposase [Trichonephila clavipes]|uniref:Transposase n=1 Tax=Trichonephila clavipes TaxID=2585209 RepID=A0A8X6SFV2_TRICX|nr:transposase [Trichonephila clavipes]
MDQVSTCKVLAKQNEINPFLKRMVSGDDKWVTYYNIVRKRSWSKCGEAAQTVAKPGLTARKVLLCIWPHTPVATRQNLWELGCEVSMHPSYSPDQEPSNYLLFLVLQNFLSDRKLGSREDSEN